LTFFPIRSLAVDPQNPSILYAGTDFDGIWKSTDAGNSWFKSSTGLYQGLIVFDIVIDPQNTDTLYAALGGGVALAIGNIYKSEDGGATWRLQDDGLPRSSETSTYTNAVFTLAIDPDNPLLLYAGTNFEGAYRSTSGGEAWTAITKGLPYLSYPEWFHKVSALAVDPHHSNRVSAIAGGKYHIFDDINGWEQISDDYLGSDAHLYFHPSDASVLYCPNGFRGFSKSADGGVNWENYATGIFDVAFHALSPDKLYGAHGGNANEIGGVYKAVDQGETWSESSNGILAQAVQSVAVDPQSGNHIYAGTGNGHFFRTEDGGETWSRGSYYVWYVDPDNNQLGYDFGAIKDIALDPLDAQKIYMAASGGLFTSTNRGEVFEEIDQVESPNCIAVSAQTSSLVYVGAGLRHGVYKSSDGGTTWVTKTAGMPTFGDAICPILSIAVDPSDPETVWAGMQYSCGIIKSIDGGNHWQVMGLTETNFIDAIAINPLNSDEMLVGGGFGDGNIFKSVDGGVTWQKKMSGIAFVQDIVYDPRDPRWVYAATEGYGVLRSFNGGETWHDFSNGIFYPLLYSLATTEDPSPRLIAGTYGSGLYWVDPSAPVQVHLPVVTR
jgi:photosystem II stability/assembly factor-like uncharacterized protein